MKPSSSLGTPVERGPDEPRHREHALDVEPLAARLEHQADPSRRATAPVLQRRRPPTVSSSATASLGLLAEQRQRRALRASRP